MDAVVIVLLKKRSMSVIAGGATITEHVVIFSDHVIKSMPQCPCRLCYRQSCYYLVTMLLSLSLQVELQTELLLPSDHVIVSVLADGATDRVVIT